MSASMPWPASALRVSSGYSELIRTPPPRLGGQFGQAVHRRFARDRQHHPAGLVVALEYDSSPSETTSLPRSSMQSRPVMPRSKRPSAT